MARYNHPPGAYRGARRRSPFAAITGAVTAALLARGHRVRSTLVFGAVCIVLLAVIAVIIVGVPKRSTNVGKVTSGAALSAQARTATPAAAAAGSTKPSASAPTSQAPASLTPVASTSATPLTSAAPPASTAPLVASAASAIPTPTPTPSPTPTPTPPPPPPVPTTCAASVSDAAPHHNEVVNVIVQTAPGAHVTVTAHYHTERTTHHAVANATGEADVPFDVLNAIYGFNVRVTVVASAAGGTLDCSTSYTPSP